MTRFAADTTVSTEASRVEIERTLTRYGAERFAYMSEPGRAKVAFAMKGKQVRFILPLPDREDDAFCTYMRGSTRFARTPAEAQKLFEQACRQRWRALALVVKAKLEAVETGITTFEDEFLAHTLMPDGRTVGEWARPSVDQAYLTGNMPAGLMIEAKP